MKHTLLIALFSFLVAGCHTMHGVGQDVSASGDAIQDAAE